MQVFTSYQLYDHNTLTKSSSFSLTVYYRRRKMRQNFVAFSRKHKLYLRYNTFYWNSSYKKAWNLIICTMSKNGWSEKTHLISNFFLSVSRLAWTAAGEGLAMVMIRNWYPVAWLHSWLELKGWRLSSNRHWRGGSRGGAGSSFSPSKMTDVSILVMVVASLVFQVSDATIGSRKADTEEDFTWKYNGEVNIGK